MKILIWFGIAFACTILNALLGYLTGIKAGVAVLTFVEVYVAFGLCQKWDERKAAKKGSIEMSSNIENTASTPVETQPKNENIMLHDNVIDVNASNKTILFCRHCGFKLIEGSEFCSNCGTKVEKEK